MYLRSMCPMCPTCPSWLIWCPIRRTEPMWLQRFGLSVWLDHRASVNSHTIASVIGAACPCESWKVLHGCVCEMKQWCARDNVYDSKWFWQQTIIRVRIYRLLIHKLQREMTKWNIVHFCAYRHDDWDTQTRNDPSEMVRRWPCCWFY